MSDLQLSYAGAGDFVLRVRCVACGAFVRADGLPILMVYTADDGRTSLSRGIMLPVPHRSHASACRGEVER